MTHETGHIDDFGNAIHWTNQVKGWHCLGLYGWADGSMMACLVQAVDFSELN